MSSSTFIRLCGLAAFIGGVLLLTASLLPLVPVAESTWNILPLAQVAASAGGLLGWVLVLLGLFGLYKHQSEASGALGLIGFLAAFLGTAMSLVGAESAPWGFVAGFVMFVLGWLLFGVATLRARVYPRTAIWLLLIGIIGSAVGPVSVALGVGPTPGFMVFLMGSNVLFAAAVAWLGLVVFAEEGGETLHQTVARVRSFLYGVLLAIVGLSGKPDDEGDDEEGTEPADTASGT